MVKALREAIVTDAELKLARALEREKIKFVAQKRLRGKNRKHLLDFYFPSRLVVQIDGRTHKTNTRKFLDEVQNSDLQQLGYVVLRFENNEIYDNLSGVVTTIKILLKSLT